MISPRILKEKRNSVTSIHKITKSMQLIATAKSQKAIKSMREYDKFYKTIIHIISKISEGVKQSVQYKKTLWIVFASDLGLAGGYNSNIIKTAKANLKADDHLVVFGQRAFSLKRGSDDQTFLAKQIFEPDAVSKIIFYIKKSFIQDQLNVKVISTKYISQLEFQPQIFNLLPIDLHDDSIEAKAEEKRNLEFEPEKEELLKQIIDIYIESTLTGLYRESVASEQTSRRVAMENATQNGEEMLKNLEIEFNRTRQAKITQEISEIIGGSEALK